MKPSLFCEAREHPCTSGSCIFSHQWGVSWPCFKNLKRLILLFGLDSDISWLWELRWGIGCLLWVLIWQYPKLHIFNKILFYSTFLPFPRLVAMPQQTKLYPSWLLSFIRNLLVAILIINLQKSLKYIEGVMAICFQSSWVPSFVFSGIIWNNFVIYPFIRSFSLIN